MAPEGRDGPGRPLEHHADDKQQRTRQRREEGADRTRVLRVWRAASRRCGGRAAGAAACRGRPAAARAGRRRRRGRQRRRQGERHGPSVRNKSKVRGCDEVAELLDQASARPVLAQASSLGGKGLQDDDDGRGAAADGRTTSRRSPGDASCRPTTTISPRTAPPFAPPSQTTCTMLIKTSHKDVVTKDGTTMRIFVYEPNTPDYPRPFRRPLLLPAARAACG